MSDVTVSGVSFGADDVVRIEFYEQRHSTDDGMVDQVLQMRVRDPKVAVMLADVQEVLAEIVDDYFVALRNPPDLIEGSAHDRLRKRDAT